MSLAVGDGRKLVERAGPVNHLPVPQVPAVCCRDPSMQSSPPADLAAVSTRPESLVGTEREVAGLCLRRHEVDEPSAVARVVPRTR